MDEIIEIDDEPVTKNRRRSIFNRTNNENATLHNCTRADIPEIEEQIIEEYSDELKQEIESWKQLLNEFRNKNAYLKGKLRTDLKEYADLDILNDDEKNRIKSAPDFSKYIDNLQEICMKAEIVAKQKQTFENLKRHNLLRSNCDINTMNYIISKKL